MVFFEGGDVNIYTACITTSTTTVREQLNQLLYPLPAILATGLSVSDVLIDTFFSLDLKAFSLLSVCLSIKASSQAPCLRSRVGECFAQGQLTVATRPKSLPNRYSRLRS